MYINAGTDSYELANLFSNNCKQQIGLDPKLKVAIGNMSSEIGRREKLCIYVESMEQAKQYIEILEKIKEEKQDFKFEKPILTAGTIDNWIGIGSDIGEYDTSYNKEICGIIINSCNKYFSNMSRAEIIEQLHKNSQLLDEVRKSISERCLQSGRSSEKICVRKEDVQLLKQTELARTELNSNEQIITGTKSVEEIINGEITPDEISEKLMQQLRESGYDGKSGHPVLQSCYQLFSKKQEEEQRRTADENKIDSLEDKLGRQNDEISALKSRSEMFESIIRNQTSKIRNIKGVLETLGNQINDLQENVRPKGILEKVRGMFAKRQNLLPVNRL